MKANLIFLFSFLLANIAFAEEATTTAAPAEQSQTQTDTQNTTEQMATDVTTDNAAALAEQSGFSRGSVMRSIFTNGIEDREPVDNMQTAGNSDNRITYFSELRDMSGQMAKHRWEHNGKVMAEVEFNVRGPRWRVWSSKSLMPQWEGEWKVSVLNAAGEVISEEMINYRNIDKAVSMQNSPDMMESTPSTETATPAQ